MDSFPIVSEGVVVSFYLLYFRGDLHSAKLMLNGRFLRDTGVACIMGGDCDVYDFHGPTVNEIGVPTILNLFGYISFEAYSSAILRFRAWHQEPL